MFSHFKWKPVFKRWISKNQNHVIYAVWEKLKTRENIPLQQYLQFSWEYCKQCCLTRVSWVLMAQESMIARIYIKGYYSRESYNKSRMYFCHTQNVISVTDKTDEEKRLDAGISFIFLFQNRNFWWSPFRFQCLNPKLPATTVTQRRSTSACIFLLSFLN